MEMDLMLNVSLGDVVLTYSMSWFSLHLFMSFRLSLSASVFYWDFSLTVSLNISGLCCLCNKSCLFLCPLFILFRWGFLTEPVFLLLLQASHCVIKGSIPHTGHTCLDHTFLTLITRTDRLKMWRPPRVRWSSVAEGCILSFLSRLVCQPAVLTFWC